MKGKSANVWIWFVGFAVIVVVAFSVGFSAGLGWTGKSSEYSGSIADQVSEDDRSLVVQKLEQCMEDQNAALRVVSFVEACLNDTEDEWDAEASEESGEKWYD